MTPGLRRYTLYIRPRQGVALTDRQSVRHPGGVAGLLATTGPRVIGAAPLRPVARKRAPTRGVFFIAIKDLCKMVFGRKSTAFSAGTLHNTPSAASLSRFGLGHVRKHTPFALTLSSLHLGYYAKVSTELLPAHRHTTIRKPNGAKHLGEVRLSLLYNSNASPLTGRTIGYFFLK